MKCNWIFISMFLVFVMIQCKSSFSQQYVPFPEANAYWTVHEHEIWVGINETYIYTVQGDTLFNNMSYKKVYQLNDTLEQDTIWKLHVCMRQDTINKRIFFIRNYLGENIEKLGYDFSIQLGDTVSLPAFAFLGYDTLFKYYYFEDSILLMNGEYRRAYWYSSISVLGYGLWVIEGIGENGGPFPYSYGDPSYIGELLCFRLDGQFIYGSEEDCDFDVNVDELLTYNKLGCYPNPANNFLNIDIPCTHAKFYDIVLINLLGNPVMKKSILPCDSSVQLDVSKIPGGCYFLLVRSDSYKYACKVIINH